LDRIIRTLSNTDDKASHFSKTAFPDDGLQGEHFTLHQFFASGTKIHGPELPGSLE